MKKILKTAAAIMSLLVLTVTVINIIVISFSVLHIKSADKADSDYDCIVILGTSVYGTVPGAQLADRINCGVSLFKSGKSNIILMSGDGTSSWYSETNVMNTYAEEQGVPAENIVTDTAGMSTYESMYRIAKFTNYKKILIVTQRYHVYRAVFIARCFGLDADGIAADKSNSEYESAAYRITREFGARVKDFFYSIFKPESQYLEEIPIG